MSLASLVRNLPLRHKVSGLTMSVCVTALCVAGVVRYLSVREEARKDLVRDLRIAAEGVARNSASALEFDDDEFAGRALEVLSVDASILSAQVRRADGHLFAVYARPGVAASAFTPLDEDGHVFGDDRLAVWLPVSSAGERLGSIAVTSDLSKVRARVHSFLRGLGISTSVAVVLAFALSWRLRGLITDPILALSGMARRIENEHDYSLRLPAASRDELGALIEAWNRMLAGIEERDRELARHRGHLEEQVAERTRALSRTNEELVVARDRAEEAARVKAEFMAKMSHELRTPMNGVIGMTALLEDTRLDEQQKSMLETVRNAGEQLLAIIKDVLDFSKIEAGKMELERVPFDLVRMIEESCDILAPRAGEKDLELALEIDPRLPRNAVGDPVRLRQVLLNLVTNAIKFTERGEVVVSAAALRERVGEVELELRVRDTGIGIAEASRDRVFRSFSQVDASMNRRYGGSGLGLTIARDLARMMGGDLDYSSRVGEGSTFRFTVRLEVPDDGARAIEPLPEALHGRAVLIADEHASTRAILCDLVRALGLEAEGRASAAEAMAALSAAEARGSRHALLLASASILDAAAQLPEQPLVGSSALAAISLVVLVPMHRMGRMADLERLRPAAMLVMPVKIDLLRRALVTVLGNGAGEKDGSTPGGLGASAGDLTAETRTSARILLVEDNPVNKRVAQGLLQKGGFTCKTASHGGEALAMVQAEPFDVLLMDCQMPEMDGYEATRRIRALGGERAKVAIVAMTANDLEGDRERCFEAGMDDYVTKPIEPKLLYETLVRALASRSRS